MTQSSTHEGSVSLPVIVIGSGGHAKVLLDLLHQLGHRVLYLTDRSESRHGQHIDGIRIRGYDEIILEHSPESVRLVNAIGSITVPLARREAYNRFRSLGYHFETMVHPTATVAKSVNLHEGAQIMAGVIIQAGCDIGENALINTAASVDHDCVIAPHVHIAPGVTLSGQVCVGEATHVGTGATAIQGVRIGKECLVAAGSVVVRDVRDGQNVRGVPAKASVDSAIFKAAPPSEEHFTVMLAAAGRRVVLLRLIRASMDVLGLRGRMLATDISAVSAAMHCGDAAGILPPYSGSDCLEKMLHLCEQYRVRLIIPTIDPDLAFLATHRERYEALGTRVMVCPPGTVDICNDKKHTHRWLTDNGFPVLPQIDAGHLLKEPSGWHFPLFTKPRFGSSSFGARSIASLEELNSVATHGDYIVQEIARGREYTVDVYVDAGGVCRCAVPRLRIETRAGEVSKAMTVRCEAIESLAARVAEALPGAVGIMNIQMFHDARSGELVVSEINPRLGGGYPLSHEAGAPMVQWAIEECLGRKPRIDPSAWRDGMVMLRYDEAVFVSAQTAGLEPRCAE